MPGKRSRLLESKINVDGSSCAVFNNFCVFLGLSSPKAEETKRPSYSEGPEAVGLGILAALHENSHEISKPRVVSSKNLDYRTDNVKIWWPYADERIRHDYKEIKDDSTYNDSPPSISIDVNAGFLPPADFLYACYLCRRRLSPQKDIYMYRGDRAFCSQECRYQQIVSDEEKELRVSPSTHSCNYSSSSIFTCVS